MAVVAVVGMVTITLFVPCIASLMMIVKEQGLKVAALMLAMIITGLQSRWQDLKHCQWRTAAFASTVMLLMFALALFCIYFTAWET